MPVRVDRTGAPLASVPLVDEVLMREIGLMAVRRIRTRTQSGKDVRGQVFQALSESYLEARARAGIGGTTASTLTLSGEMLNAMQVTSVSRRMATISFVTGSNRPARGGTLLSRSRQTGAMAKAGFAMGGGRVLREFFALSPEDEAAIEAAVERHLDRVVR